MLTKNISILSEKIDTYKDYGWFEKLGIVDELYEIKEIQNSIKDYKPKIAVIGEFSTGKSTLINSLLGIDILPAKFQPTTFFITEIIYNNEEYILADGERYPLTKENIEQIKELKSNKMQIYIKNDILTDFIIVDTPGTNDPSRFSDEIVFDLVGESDIILFLMNINQALKETEKVFISKLIREKDLEKFFFIINFADIVENPRIVKNEVIDKLSAMLNLDSQILKSHTLIYSSLEVLKSRLKGLNDDRYSSTIEKITDYVKHKKIDLINSFIESEKEKIINSILLKIEVLKDKLNGNWKKYEQELVKINEEITKFSSLIDEEIINLEKSFMNIKDIYKKDIEKSIQKVIEIISSEIKDTDLSQIKDSRYIELRLKKLLEDMILEDTKNFTNSMVELVKDFDEKVIKLSTNQFNFSVNIPQQVGNSRNLVKLGGVVGAGIGIASMLPTITTGASIFAVGGFFSAVGPALVAIPYVGPLLGGLGAASAAVLPIVASAAVTLGRILFDVGKWGVDKLGDIAVKFEEKAKKMSIINEVKRRLDEVRKDITSKIYSININDFRENYINSKFPQKLNLENKIKVIKSKRDETFEIVKENLNGIDDFEVQLKLMI